MYALFLVLNETDYLDEILARFVDVGVQGATILDSQGMASALVRSGGRDFPLCGSLKAFMEGARPYNKTIFTVLDNEQLVERTVSAVQDVLGEVDHPSVGFMFSVPIGQVYPLGQSR